MKEFLDLILQYISSITLSVVFSTIIVSNFDTNKLSIGCHIVIAFFATISGLWICKKLSKDK